MLIKRNHIRKVERMSGGMMLLQSKGPEDVYLTGEPDVSFFKSAYKRYTNFSRVTEKQTIEGTPAVGGVSKVRFERKGDILSYVYITAVNKTLSYEEVYDGESHIVYNDPTPTIYCWGKYIDKVELYIGGALIDSQDFLYSQLIATDVLAQNLSMSGSGNHAAGVSTACEFYPLRFFFCENVNSSIPLCALRYQDVEIMIHWQKIPYTNAGTVEGFEWEVHANYGFLDQEEVKYLVSNPMDMLITQVQTLQPSFDNVQELPLCHPVKFLCSHGIEDVGSTGDLFVWLANRYPGINGLTDRKTKVKLQINGQDVTSFKYAVPHYTSIISYYHSPFDNGNDQSHFLYPFCIDTSKMQPCGTFNFSRVDSARLITEGLPITQPIYAINYNILRIENGMGAVMFAN